MSDQNVFRVRTPEGKVVTMRRNDKCMCGSGKKFKNCHYQEIVGQEHAQRAAQDQAQQRLLAMVMQQGVLVPSHASMMQVAHTVETRLAEGKPIADPVGSAVEEAPAPV